MTSDPAVVRPWDPPGLPPRTEAQRCANRRGLCAYRDDDPTRCPRCHRAWTQIADEVKQGLRADHGCEAKYGKALRRTQAPTAEGEGGSKLQDVTLHHPVVNSFSRTEVQRWARLVSAGTGGFMCGFAGSGRPA